jgi:16S rRNA (uracil1498-N3)-methyltransferase
MSRRFYVSSSLTGAHVQLDPPLAQRLAKVLRLRAGDVITLFDGSGSEALARLEHIDTRGADAAIIEVHAGLPEPRTLLHLYQSISKGERFEWLIEKGTELGVHRFVPLLTSRAVVKTPGGAARPGRWRRIAIEAAEQCGRSAVPDVAAPVTFDDAISAASGVLLLPFEAAGDTAPSVRAALAARIDDVFALGSVCVFIGPEGGFTPREVDRARAAGAVVVTIGARVLRSETAGIVAATLVMEALGELG